MHWSLLWQSSLIRSTVNLATERAALHESVSSEHQPLELNQAKAKRQGLRNESAEETGSAEVQKKERETMQEKYVQRNIYFSPIKCIQQCRPTRLYWKLWVTLNAKKLQFQLGTSFIKCRIDPTSLSLSSLSCIPTLHVFIKLNKLHVCLTWRLANWDTGSFIKTQSARFSPAKLIGRTTPLCRCRSFRLSQLCSSHWHPTKSFSLNQGIKPGTTAIVLLYLVARTVK